MKTPLLFLTLFVLGITPALAESTLALQAEGLSLLWVIPFGGILLCLSLCPLFLPNLWHHHYGKIGAAWALLTLGGMIQHAGLETAAYEVCHTYLAHYFPFIILVGALFTISGGIKVTVHAPATPFYNTVLLCVGSFVASLIGTTGAAMLFIRPLLAINKERAFKTHSVIFFILLVCNAGGSLSAIGDPPLFLGFLSGIDFFWPTKKLFWPTLIILIPLLVLYAGIDHWYLKKETLAPYKAPPGRRLIFAGKRNIPMMVGAIALVLVSGFWKSPFYLSLMDVKLYAQDLVRDLGLVGLTWASWRYGPRNARRDNDFSWEPLVEVAKLFAAIFITAAPVMTILKAGDKGSMAALVSLVTQDGQPVNGAYFWLSGILSAFLDNAPTYLVFFSLSGGDPKTLMGALDHTLMAFSLGSVFMGALTYIGNAPNFMVKSIAESQNVAMPSFFGYMAWSCGLLLPLFLLLTILLF